jgi:hypothetical protein
MSTILAKIDHNQLPQNVLPKPTYVYPIWK